MHSENPTWLELRSNVYIRDKGICWICNEFVQLNEYDLGHLIDRCNGGIDAFDNLVVMHKTCNLSKPRHESLEEAMRWKLTIKTMTKRLSKTIQPPGIDINHDLFKAALNKRLTLTVEDRHTLKQLTLKYFKDNPELLKPGDNPARSGMIRQIANEFEINHNQVRQWLIAAGLIQKRHIIVTKDAPYYYIYNNLESLVDKFNALTLPRWERPEHIGITRYGLDIMFYLAGAFDWVNNKHRKSIERRVNNLGLKVRKFTLI